MIQKVQEGGFGSVKISLKS